MVYVPWRELGICPFNAIQKATCHFGDRCTWAHLSEETIRHIWDIYTVAEQQGKAPDPIPHFTRRLPLPSDQHFAGTNGANNKMHHHHLNQLPPRPLLQQRYPDADVRRDDFRQSRDTPAISLPLLEPRSRGSLSLPHSGEGRPTPSTQNDFERTSDWRMEGSWTRRDPTLSPMAQDDYYPHYLLPVRQAKEMGHSERYRQNPAFHDERHDYREYGFDAHSSHNPYVNGARAYRFVWGQPLCVRCGTVGHLPKECKNGQLSKDEQDYLYKIVKEEQNRTKMERGVVLNQLTSSLASRSESVPRPKRESSLLDVPPSPKAYFDNEFESQSDYWKRHDEQQLQKQRSLMCDENEIMLVDTGAAHKSLEEMSKNARNKTRKCKRLAAASAKDAEEEEKMVDVEAGEGFYVAGAAREKAEESLLNSESPATFTTTTAPPAPALAPPTASVPSFQQDTADMVATKRLSNGEAKTVGPHPSTVRVSASYITQSAVEKRLQISTALDAHERSLAEAREDSVRLQGVTWLDTVRRALQLPVRTFTTACVYYHKFRLAHPSGDYNWSDAAAASLLTSCKNEDTLKKSRDILAAAYNLKQPASHELVGADDSIFEQPSRLVIGLERLVLESGGFDFRSRSPHQALVKISKSLPKSDDLKSVSQLAWTILTDLHRTFAPLKQTSATLALASLELAAHFKATTSVDNTCTVRDNLQALDLSKWSTAREEVMETLLDALDLFTHHTTSTILGTKYSLDDFLRIRLAFNKECSDCSLPRYTIVQPPPSPDNTNGATSTLRVTNGHPTPVSPPQPGTQALSQSSGTGQNQPTPEGGGTLRFMLNPQRATEERAEVKRYYTEEWEEYEEEIEVPVPRNRSRERDRVRQRDDTPGRQERGRYRDDDWRTTRDDRDLMRGLPSERNRDRESLRSREREAERERTWLRDRDREKRYDDRRYDDRERNRRYDDRRERDRDRDRDRDRRHHDDDRRRGRDSR